MLIPTMIIIFILGLVFGSFGSVLLTRIDKVSLKTLNSVFFGRSMCPQCKKTLKAQHLFPLFSFLFQKGKCAFCGKKIPWIYFLLELGTGTIFLLTYLALYYFVGDFSWGYLAFWLALNRLFFLLVVFDIEKFELHVPLRAITVLLVLIPQFFGQIGAYKRAFFGSLIFGGFFYLLYFVAKFYVRKRYKTDHEGIGEGDAMLAFVIGATMPIIFQLNNITFAGLNLVEMLMLFLILSSVVGLLLASVMTTFGTKKTKIGEKSTIVMPFIPSMIIAFWVLCFFAENIFLVVFPSLG